MSGNAQATTANIVSHEAMFRMAILSDVAAGVLTLFVTMALFRLFRRVDRDLAWVMLILGGFMHSCGVVVNEMFWGLWLLPFGMLILKSRLLPRFIAIWLFLNGGAYILLCVLGVLSPSLEAGATGLVFPFMLAEVVTMLWLAFGRLRPESLLAAEH